MLYSSLSTSDESDNSSWITTFYRRVFLKTYQRQTKENITLNPLEVYDINELILRFFFFCENQKAHTIKKIYIPRLVDT